MVVGEFGSAAQMQGTRRIRSCKVDQFYSGLVELQGQLLGLEFQLTFSQQWECESDQDKSHKGSLSFHVSFPLSMPIPDAWKVPSPSYFPFTCLRTAFFFFFNINQFKGSIFFPQTTAL